MSLLADEAHRIRETSDDRFTKMAERNRRSQIDELLDASKVSVFLSGRASVHAAGRGRQLGSWSARPPLAGRSPFGSTTWPPSFDAAARVSTSTGWTTCLASAPRRRLWTCVRLGNRCVPDDLELFLDSAEESESARLVAGFCWKWSEPLGGDALVDDVVIGDWRRPWNRKVQKNKAYKPNRHPYTLWATTAEGPEQVGCIYSAQGFEFDRVGVIWGPDLVWRGDRWVGDKKKSKDGGLKGATGDEVTRLLRHAYRVLLTRGMKKTMVLCLDEETRRHVIESVPRSDLVAQ